MAIKKSRRSGVALIVVLGLVAILMIVSVAFTIHMRVERAGAANLRHAAIARQVVKGGLAAALMAIDKQAGDSAVPEWNEEGDVTSLTYNPFTKYSNVKGWLWRDTFISFNPRDGDNYGTRNNQHTHNKDVSGKLNATLFSEEVAKYFPAGLAYRGYATAYSPPDNTDGSKWRPIIQPQWQPVFADTENDNVMGRYAFFVLDTTGMLDASCMTNSAISRWMGRDPGEMDVSLMPDVANAREFAKKNFDCGTYETLAEFAALTGDDNAPDNYSFNTFSEDPGPTNNLIYIGGSADEIRRHKKEIIAAFYDCGLTAGEQYGKKEDKDCEQARWAYLGLVDFVDSDEKMEDDDKIKPYQRPVTENMPLLSGFMAKLAIEAEHSLTTAEDGSTTTDFKMRLVANFTLPFVCPFITKDSVFDLEGKARLIGDLCENADLAALIPDDGDEKRVSSSAAGEVHDNIVTGLKIDSGWVTFPAANYEELLELDGFEVIVEAAGATYAHGESDPQHCYPVYLPQYEDGAEGESWLMADFNPKKEGLSINKDQFREVTKETTKDGKTASVTTKTWAVTNVVWAEIFDPRFSCQALGDRRSVRWDNDIQKAYYKPSHKSTREAGYLDTPVTKITGLDGFGDFGELEIVKKLKEVGKNPFDYNGHFRGRDGKLGLGDPFGYFGESTDGRIMGLSPLTAYILSHPKTIKDYYGMPIDGFQNLEDAIDDNRVDPIYLSCRMYVKNAPLESVGELGYLPIGVWQTIRLYDYDDGYGRPGNFDLEWKRFAVLPENDGGGYFHPVLDHFTVVPEDEVVRGRVNLNTLNQHILATVFHKMPVWTDGYATPSANSGRIDGPANHTTDSIDLLAQAIVDYRNEAGSFTKLSELGYLFADGFLTGGDKNYSAEAASNAAGGDRNLGEFEREAIIRNSCGLFTLRGQTFIVVVKGESYSPPFGRKKSLDGGTSNSSKTAVAEVWRDSVPDANGNHPMYVKFFKIIDD